MSARIHKIALSDNAFEPINLAHSIVSSNWIFRGINVHWSAVPGTAESVTVIRESSDGSEYNTMLLNFDPTIDGVNNWACCDATFWFNAGDTIRVQFPNSDNLTVGVTIWVQEET